MQFVRRSGLTAIVMALTVFGTGDYRGSSAVAQDTGYCAADDTYAIALHGGAVFSRTEHGFQTTFLQEVLAKSQTALIAGARAIDVVEASIAEMENSGLFNAGKGAVANQAGVVEMDASIMDGRDLTAGAVASVKTTRNPVSAARLVMDKSRYVMMVGPGAEDFVSRSNGATVDAGYFLYNRMNFENVPLPEDLEIAAPDKTAPADKVAFSGIWGAVVDGSYNHVLVVEKIGPGAASVISALGPHRHWGEGYFVRLPAAYVEGGIQVTEPTAAGVYVTTYTLNADGTLKALGKAAGTPDVSATLRRIPKPRADTNNGTVGAVVRDRCGDLAAGTSTGGFGSKKPGRVGDSPIIGAGTYADNETVAVSATGHGEYFMRHVVAYAISAAMRYKNLSVGEASKTIIEDDLARKGLRGGVIAVDPDGNIAASFNTRGMVRGTASSSQPPKVEVF